MWSGVCGDEALKVSDDCLCLVHGDEVVREDGNLASTVRSINNSSGIAESACMASQGFNDLH